MENNTEERLTSYEISITETELIIKIQAEDENLIVSMRVNQAFAFLVHFIIMLGKLASPLSPEGALGMPDKGGGEGGEDGEGNQGPLSSSSLAH